MGPIIADITRAVITLGLVGTCAWLWLAGGEGPPAELTAIMGACLGTYIRPTLAPKS